MKRKLAYLTAILATATLAACSAPSTTTMTDEGKKVKMSAEQTLQAYNWSLINTVTPDGSSVPAWTSNDPQFNQPLVLNFIDDRVAIENLCNPLNASYAITERNIDFSQVVSAMRMCSDQKLMQYEQQVANLLPTATDWSLASTDQTQANAAAPVLTLYFENGEKWRFGGKQTNETKYGSPAETVFLEIAPQTEVCPQSGNNCLKVRSVNYDSNGMKTGVGEWVLFQPNAIEGFNHEPGVRSVIRTHRYHIKNAPAGSANYAYEFDMMVESGQVM